jgi:hypothetical protein
MGRALALTATPNDVASYLAPHPAAYDAWYETEIVILG